MKTDRRTFLFNSAGATAALALPGLCGCHSTKRPEALKDALSQMRAENKPGLAIRLTKDKRTRCDPGHALMYRQNEDDADWREVFCEGMFVCLEDATLQDHLRGANPSHAIVAFDADGYVEDGVSFDFQKDWEQFFPTVRSLLHGPGDARLLSRALALRKKTDPVVLEALDRLAGQADRDLLVEKAATIMPLLVYERVKAQEETRHDDLREVIGRYFDSCPTALSGPRLPFGVQARPGGGGCGDNCEECVKVAVACGMGFAGPKSRSFVKYLTN
jgi:hypothetical protein